MRRAILPVALVVVLTQAVFAQTLRVLTYNVGLLKVVRSDHVPMVDRRAALAPELIAAEARKRSPDIILLQEVWKPDHADAVRTHLEAEGYTVVRPTARGFLSGMTSGLLLAVRKPLELEDWSFRRFGANTFLESLARKGVLEATIRMPQGQRFALVGTHMIALDTRAGAPSVPRQVTVFRRQADQVLAALSARSLDRAVPALILGDFNVGPGYADAEYRRIADAPGVKEAAVGLAEADAPTWDPENPLVKYGRYPDEPAAKIDHVFLVSGPEGGWRVQSLERRFVDPVPGLSLDTEEIAGIPSPLSDHYGLEVVVTLDGGE